MFTILRRESCALDQVEKRFPWAPLSTGAAVSVGLHSLLIAKTGLFPPPAGDVTPIEAVDAGFSQWYFWFFYVSAVPVFVLVVIGAVLAPFRSRLGPLGIGMVIGAVASPLLWVTSTVIYQRT